ncbi:Prolyl oligopeptidase [Gracilaria domingensis]|nr:Prolyl oligopeptidase [Gracilaria domingensis]
MKATPSDSGKSSAKLWAELCFASPSLRSAHLMRDDANSVTAIWTQRDVIASCRRFYSTTYTCSEGQFLSSPPVEVKDSSAVNSYYSPTRSKLVRFTSKDESRTKESAITAEIWSSEGGLLKVWEIPDTVHGPIFTDEWFGRVTWSPDETMIAYVADRPKPQKEKQKDIDPLVSWREPLSFKFDEDARMPLGEAYVARRSPAIFVANVQSGKVCLASDLSDVSPDSMFGEPEWSPDGEWIVATMRRGTYASHDEACEQEHLLPYDLGIRYCYNRFSAIVVFAAPATIDDVVDMPKSMKVISSDTDFADFCCNSPRFAQDSHQIVYTTTPREEDAKEKRRISPHNATKILRCVSLRSGSFGNPYTLIDIPVDPAHNDFPGLYLHALPGNPWLDSKTLVFNTVWGSINKVLAVRFNTRRGNFEPHEELSFTDLSQLAADVLSESKFSGTKDYYDISQGNIEVLDIWGSTLLVSASNPANPPQMFLLRTKEAHKIFSVELINYHSESVRALRKCINSFATYDMVAQDPSSRVSLDMCARLFDNARDAPHTRFQITVLTPPPRNQATKLVVFPHGGPHVSTLNGYSLATMALLQSGYAVLYVNYRGSLGLGQRSLESLPGRIGTQEINEVVQATRWAIREYSFNRTHSGFVGGSHSGFIGAHTSLVANLFSRTVLRNPVVDVAGMVASTDIPDWCFCESGSRATEGLVPDERARAKMDGCSPVNFVDEAHEIGLQPGKTLLQVGGMDKRVPAGQSLTWRRKMNTVFGKDTVILRWYDRCGHAIDEVPEGDDAWVCALDFLAKMGK